MQITEPFIQTLTNIGFCSIDVLRLDKVHNIVSGNKWYKLQYYLQQAIQQQYSAIATFGGAFSNHIVATAFACQQLQLKCYGIIRGEKPQTLSHTLMQAQEYGMELIFLSRTDYAAKNIFNLLPTNTYVIDEGGYGKLGALGAATILQKNEIEKYSHIMCACGTGTTLAGIIQTALPHQKIIGIAVLKGYENMNNDVKEILPSQFWHKPFEINHQYHFGGYAKKTKELISFMNSFYMQQKIPTDFVYTAKLFYAISDLINTHQIEANARVLALHSGGLQGNLSLPKGTLVF